MQKRMKVVYIVGLLIATVIINGNTPIKAELPPGEHQIKLDPNMEDEGWNKHYNYSSGWEGSTHVATSDQRNGYCKASVDTGLLGEEQATAGFYHWFEWTATCNVDVSLVAEIAFESMIDTIFYQYDTWLDGWARIRLRFSFFVDDRKEWDEWFDYSGSGGQGAGPKTLYNTPAQMRWDEDDPVLTFDKGQIYDIGIEVEVFTHCSGNAMAEVLVRTHWQQDQTSDTSDIDIYWTNRPPEKPEKPNGETNGKVGQTYYYTSSTTDDDFDGLKYQWDWNDGGFSKWYGPYASGETCVAEYEWDVEGAYAITVRAKDDFGGISVWSDPLDVTMPKNTGCVQRTPINMAYGSSPSVKNIEDIEVGDYISSYDTELQVVVPAEVTAIYNYTIPDNPLDIGYNFENNSGVAPDLFIFINGTEWVKANDTGVDYYVLENTPGTNDTFLKPITSINESYILSHDVYDLEIKPLESGNVSGYFADGILVGERIPPEITNVFNTLDTVGFGFNVTITADVIDKVSGVDVVKAIIIYPDDSRGYFSMNNIENNTYEYIFPDTWLVGQYNYSIWAMDEAYNTANSTGHIFNVSAQATVSICTIKDSYGSNEIINITDPPPDDPPSEPSPIGYELLDNNKVLHIWNKYDSYYFNTSSGIQLTNHYNEYWSHNVLMLGYYNNDEWNLLYRTDELSGFNKDVSTDNKTYVNATLWKDLTYSGYDFLLALRYHLKVNDYDLTVIPYIKNLDQAIPYELAFGWEINDIKIANTTKNNYLQIYNGTDFEKILLNQTLDRNFPDMDFNTTIKFICTNPPIHHSTRSLYLSWNRDLTYKVTVKSRPNQYNAPTTLFIKVGTLDVDQEKFTMMHWLDSEDPHDPIYISGNDEFTEENGVTGGSGTEGDPYIIEGWDISEAYSAVDQENTDGYGYGYFTDTGLAQTFITEMDGELNSIKLSMKSVEEYGEDIYVDIYEGDPDTGDWIGSGIIAGFVDEQFGWREVLLDYPIWLYSYETYSIVVFPPWDVYEWECSWYDAYPFGELWIEEWGEWTPDYDDDFLFKTYMGGGAGIWIENTDKYFTIRDCRVHNIMGMECYGIKFQNVIRGTICNVTVEDNSDGIFFDYYSDNNKIIDCIIDNNYWSVYGGGSNNDIINCTVSNSGFGIYYFSGRIKDCEIYGNTPDGISGCNDAVISNCGIHNNYHGIVSSSSSPNTVVMNCTIEHNTDTGIYFWRSSSNCLFYNNYINNSNNIKGSQSNKWNITKILGENIIGGHYLGGNYWNNYNGEDTDGDGLGDTEIPHGPGDYLPLTTLKYNYAPTQSDQKIWNIVTSTEKTLNATDVSLYPTSFNITINDLDGEKMNITLKTNESGSWTIVNQTSGSGLSNGTYSFTNMFWIDSYNTTYYISFNLTDNTEWTNEMYHFTTESETVGTSVDAIDPYTQTSSPLTITASGSPDLDNVSLWYQYSDDNSSWGGGGENWWNNSWMYQKQCNISNNIDDYQMKIIVSNNYGGDISCNGHAQSDFDDIRFISNSTGGEISYWRENYIADTQATFWINNIYNDSKILMYYGNSVISTTSNGNDTWIFFDDFNSGTEPDTEKWYELNENGGDCTVSNGLLKCDGAFQWATRARVYSNTYFNVSNSSVNGYRVKTRITDISTDVADRSTYCPTTEHWLQTGRLGTYNDYSKFNSGGLSSSLFRASPPYTIDIGIYNDGSDVLFRSYYNDEEKTLSGTPTGDGVFQLRFYAFNRDHPPGTVSKLYADWICLGLFKNTSAPYWGSFGSEQGTSNWAEWNDISNPDTNSPWSWEFDFPEGKGYYEFYSIGTKDNIVESAPSSADAQCFYEKQSKINNNGFTDIKGYLLIQVHYYNETLQQWVVADDTVNKTTSTIINSSEQLALDQFFNDEVNTNDLISFGSGTYRVYTAFRDPYGNILKCDDETEMVATYEFDIIFN